ncbi:hypothetical protein TIFTF001_047554 [Ficus carica]|uniref:Uncharacterized protein n=1 Tax=Ficus carica TaxID=3494 RepID=A0AA88CNG0_FICCA|nr:hypothetical protein TIFTF001_047554 [Ficus carica]
MWPFSSASNYVRCATSLG